MLMLRVLPIKRLFGNKIEWRGLRNFVGERGT